MEMGNFMFFSFMLLWLAVALVIAAISSLNDIKEHRLRCSKWRSKHDIEIV